MKKKNKFHTILLDIKIYIRTHSNCKFIKSLNLCGKFSEGKKNGKKNKFHKLLFVINVYIWIPSTFK